MQSMKTLKARVENGHIVMNEPTDLPEGTELELIPADDFDDGSDHFNDPEFVAGLDEADEQIKRGETLSGSELIERLRKT